MATFGYTSVGGTNDANLQGHILATKFTLTENGTITKYTSNIIVVGTETLKCAIYDTSKNLVAGSATSDQLVSSSGWIDFSLSVGLALTTGQYYLAIWAKGDAITLGKYDAGDTAQAFDKAEVWGDYPASISGESEVDRKYSIYATYTPAVSGGSINTLSNEQRVTKLAKSTTKTFKKLSDQLVEKLGTTRISEIKGKIGNSKEPYEKLLNDYLNSL